jgi:hypothetical protein
MIHVSDIRTAVEAIQSKVDEYQLAEQYYEGTQGEIFASQTLARLLGGHAGDFRTNFASVPVNAVLDRLEIAAITGVAEGANERIGELMESNEFIIESEDIHRSTLVYGDSYVTVWPVEGQTTIYYNNPKSTTIVYDDENPRLKRFAAKLWEIDEEGTKYQRLNIYYPDRVEKYRVQGSEPVKDASKWSLIDSVENPYEQVPVFHFRTNRPYGSPEHKAAYGPQDAINKLVATQMHAIDYQGAPQRYALANGDSPEATDFNEGSTDRENIGRLKNGPGELWYLKGVDKVGQFEPGDPKAFIEPLREYVKAMATATSTPVHYFERALNVPSGESLRVAESPLVKKVNSRQASFGSTWREVFRFALALEGLGGDVQVKWQKHESTDQLTDWELALKKIRAGVPLEQVLVEQGYDLELVQGWIANGAVPLIPGLTTDILEHSDSTVVQGTDR